MDPEHDIGWAVAKLRDGYKIRRKHWEKGKYLVLDETNPEQIVKSNNQVFAGFSTESALAYDWVLADG